MIQLRDAHPDDMERLRRWRNQPAISQCMYTDHYIGEDEHESWFKSVMADPTRRYWIIVHAGDDVGLTNLYDIDYKNKRCFWAFYIGEDEARGKGIGSLVEYKILSFVFDDMKFNKLCCEVLASNTPVVTLHKGFGFREEGVFRQHILKQGSFHDVHSLSILREEWLQIRPQLEKRFHRMEKGE